MAEKKTIAFYCSSLTKGGAERVFANLAEYFTEKGYTVYMVTQYKQEDEYCLKPGITVSCPILRLGKKRTEESAISLPDFSSCGIFLRK